MNCYCVIIALLVIAGVNCEMTKSWKSQPKSSSNVQDSIKIDDKLHIINRLRGSSTTKRPTARAPVLKIEKSGAVLVGGFENNSKRLFNATKPIPVNNKLDPIRARMHQIEELPKYDIGPGVNLTLDVPREIVNVNLDEEYIKDIFMGNNSKSDSVDKLKDTSNLTTGRGRKQLDLIMKIIPLFIIPFLIQSAIIPFLVSMVKLLLVKSILIGKTAIFLIIVSALKNLYKNSHVYEVPVYNYDPPLRRSEIIPPGYKIEGTQQWLN